MCPRLPIINWLDLFDKKVHNIFNKISICITYSGLQYKQLPTIFSNVQLINSVKKVFVLLWPDNNLLNRFTLTLPFFIGPFHDSLFFVPKLRLHNLLPNFGHKFPFNLGKFHNLWPFTYKLGRKSFMKQAHIFGWHISHKIYFSMFQKLIFRISFCGIFNQTLMFTIIL